MPFFVSFGVLFEDGFLWIFMFSLYLMTNEYWSNFTMSSKGLFWDVFHAYQTDFVAYFEIIIKNRYSRESSPR